MICGRRSCVVESCSSRRLGGCLLSDVGFISPLSIRFVLSGSAWFAIGDQPVDFFGYPIPLEELNFHVAYLSEKGLVSVEGVRGPHTHRNVSLVKITAKGIDYRDGRLPADDGIYLEPGK